MGHHSKPDPLRRSQPGFSQVEADAVQLQINEQFALFYPEARPFFLESADYFNTKLNLLYTRMVADPSAALKLGYAFVW